MALVGLVPGQRWVTPSSRQAGWTARFEVGVAQTDSLPSSATTPYRLPVKAGGGAPPVTTDIAATIGPWTAALSAKEAIRTDVAGTVAPWTAALSVSEAVRTSIGATTVPWTAALSVSEAVRVSVAGTWPAWIAALTATEAMRTSIAATLAPWTAALTTTEAMRTSISGTLVPWTAALSVSEATRVAIAAVLKPWTAALSAKEAVRVSLGALWKPWTAAIAVAIPLPSTRLDVLLRDTVGSVFAVRVPSERRNVAPSEPASVVQPGRPVLAVQVIPGILEPMLVGSDVEIPVTIQFGGIDADPDTLTFTLITPRSQGVVAKSETFTYGVASELSKDAVGRYKFSKNFASPGRWIYYWTAIKSGKTVLEKGTLQIDELPVPS